MKIKLIVLLFVTAVSFNSCVSIKSTLKNVDENAPIPKLTAANTFLITAFSQDSKYGFNRDYPVNVFYKNSKDENSNPSRYLNALSGPNGEKVFFTKIEVCCPFPTKNSEMGGGILHIYEVTWLGLKKPLKLYLNIYEKGTLLVPVGFGLAK